MPKKKPENCWTCRLRRKKCDGTVPVCRVCANLGISCHYSETQPEWMDGGSRQKAEAQRQKSEVKSRASQKRKEKIIRRIQSELLPCSDQDEFHPRASLTAATAEAPGRHSQPDSAAEDSSPLWLPNSDGDYEIGLAVAFMDHAFPLLFPFYQPAVLDGSRTWLLAMMMKDRTFRLQTNAITSYLLSVIPCRSETITNTCKLYALEGAQRARDLATAHFQADLAILITRNIHDNIFDTASLLINMASALDLERVLADGDEWQVHLQAALDLLRDLLRDDSGLQASSWPLILGQLSDASIPVGSNMWSVEQAAFRFSVAKLVVFDIVASSSLERPPSLLSHHQELLRGDRDLKDRNPLNLADVNGCQNWAMCLLGEVVALGAWKKEQANTRYGVRLNLRAEELRKRLESGLSQIDQSPASPTTLTLDTITARSSPSTSLVTKLWAYATLALLYTIVEGWQPASDQVQEVISRAIAVLKDMLLFPMHLRAQAWPLFIVGCLAPDEERIFYRNLTEKMGALADFGPIQLTRRIWDKIWTEKARSIDLVPQMLAMKLPSLLIMATALLLMGTLVPFVLALPANPEPTQAVNLEGGQFLRKNTQLLALPESCTAEQKKWQPAMDFDKDGCYNTPFINIQGKLAEGLSNWYTDPAVGCRNASYLDNNNVYVRSRCNNGWCAHMYAYYFEKDVYVADFADPAGKQHSFQHIVVYVEQKTGQAKQVSLTCGTINPPSNYQFNCHADDQSRSHFEGLIWQMGWDRLFWDNDTHIKVVYHKEGGLGHRFRFAKRNEAPENHKNKWFYGQLVDWDQMPKNLTTILNKHTWPPGVAFGIPDGLTATAKDKIDKEEQAEIKFGTPPNDHKTIEEQHKYEDTIFSEWLRRSNWWHKDLGRFNPNGTYYLGGATHEGDDTAMRGPDS